MSCPYGEIVSNWKTEKGTFKWNITVPPNSTATVYVPATKLEYVIESGKKISEAAGVTFMKIENGKALLKVESGSYTFITKMN